MVRQRQFGHLKAVRLRDHVHPLLVRTARRDDQPDFVQIGHEEHVVGDDQVAQVHGVERPEVQAHAAIGGRRRMSHLQWNPWSKKSPTMSDASAKANSN